MYNLHLQTRFSHNFTVFSDTSEMIVSSDSFLEFSRSPPAKSQFRAQ